MTPTPFHLFNLPTHLQHLEATGDESHTPHLPHPSRTTLKQRINASIISTFNIQNFYEYYDFEGYPMNHLQNSSSSSSSSSSFSTPFPRTVMLLPTGVVVVIVLAVLCAILGLIYAYVYFTKIHKNSLDLPGSLWAGMIKSSRNSSELLRVHNHHYREERSRRESTAQTQPPSTHVFLFKNKR